MEFRLHHLIFDGWKMKPNCFQDEEQFIQWMEMDKNVKNITKARGNDRADAYQPFVCINCTPTYAAQMRLEGRCERPDVKFRFDESEGEFIGYDPQSKVPTKGKHPGVSKHKQSGRYQVRVWVAPKKSVNLGLYAEESDAIAVYNANVDRVKLEYVASLSQREAEPA